MLVVDSKRVCALARRPAIAADRVVAFTGESVRIQTRVARARCRDALASRCLDRLTFALL
jgi:hypothetical protein